MADAKRPPVQTAATMTHVPEGARPEEFLRDEDLVGFYARLLEATPEDDPARPEIARSLRQARRAAAATREALAEAEETPE